MARKMADLFALLRLKLSGHSEWRFYFDLAFEFKMPVRELLKRMTSRELTWWKVYGEVRHLEEKNPQKSADILQELKAKVKR